jgi:GAF domain-containing protein
MVEPTSTDRRPATDQGDATTPGFELAGVFARVSGLLLSEHTVQTLLSLITELAHDTMPATVGAGITLVDEQGTATTSAASGPVVDRADRLQHELGEGPCLQAFSRREMVRCDDLTKESPWPRWAEAAASLGLRSVLSAPLVTGDVNRGAIKVYSQEVAAYGPADEHRLSMFSAQAAVLVANQQTHEQASRLSDELKTTLRRRDLVAMARGVLMGREGVDTETAFRMLISMARQRGTTVDRLADELVRSTPRPRR